MANTEVLNADLHLSPDKNDNGNDDERYDPAGNDDEPYDPAGNDDREEGSEKADESSFSDSNASEGSESESDYEDGGIDYPESLLGIFTQHSNVEMDVEEFSIETPGNCCFTQLRIPAAGYRGVRVYAFARNSEVHAEMGLEKPYEFPIIARLLELCKKEKRSSCPLFCLQQLGREEAGLPVRNFAEASADYSGLPLTLFGLDSLLKFADGNNFKLFQQALVEKANEAALLVTKNDLVLEEGGISSFSGQLSYKRIFLIDDFPLSKMKLVVFSQLKMCKVNRRPIIVHVLAYVPYKWKGNSCFGVQDIMHLPITSLQYLSKLFPKFREQALKLRGRMERDYVPKQIGVCSTPIHVRDYGITSQALDEVMRAPAPAPVVETEVAKASVSSAPADPKTPPIILRVPVSPSKKTGAKTPKNPYISSDESSQDQHNSSQHSRKRKSKKAKKDRHHSPASEQPKKNPPPVVVAPPKQNPPPVVEPHLGRLSKFGKVTGKNF